MLTLTVQQRQNLKARAHPLEPVVIIGNAGLTSPVLAEIDRALKSHELIKIRAAGDRESRDAMLQEICDTLNASAVQHIGRILVVYRPLEGGAEKKPVSRKRRKPLTKKQLAGR